MDFNRRSFALKYCWFLVLFIVLRQGKSEGFCKKNAEDDCKKVFLFKDNVKVLTVATEENHGFERFMRSAKVYGLDVAVLGKGKKWTGGDMNHPGGGQKINLIKHRLNEMMQSESDHTIVLFTDSYDVLFLASIDDIVKKFKAFPDTRVLFSAEQYCWPDTNLVAKYPKLEVANPYLNSGGFIGYVPELYKILNHRPVNDKEDDQLYYTKIYLDPKLRESLKITLDHNSVIFQNLNGALSDIQLKTIDTMEAYPYIENVITKERPLIVHGNRQSKLTLNHLGNYLAQAWSVRKGCILCNEKRITLGDELPTVMMAVFIEQATPFLEEFLDQILNIDYPKEKIHLFLRNNAEYHETEVNEFFQTHSKKYATAKRNKPSDFITESEARTLVREHCVNSACDYLFSVDSLSRIDANTLRYLLSSKYDVIAPLLVRPGHAWSNFWGAINTAGYYARSTDYMDIMNGSVKGVWNVPFITNCYLINMSVLKTPAAKAVTYSREGMDRPDMAFCASLRDLGIFMHVSNELDLGHLVNPETYNTSLTHPDMYQIFENNIEWSNRYLHEDYLKNFEGNRTPPMPCPDVFWFPLMSKRYCSEWIDIVEAYGDWNFGTKKDRKLPSGYKTLSTRNIHMNLVGLEKHWLYIVGEYVRPLQEMVFAGYYHYPPVSEMNFVLRYKPDDLAFLRPHQDVSTYTINLALNTPNVDYEGGGCRFIRYNCSVRDMKRGWVLIHPGRLTHAHEGLLITKGTRYLMVSFIDP